MDYVGRAVTQSVRTAVIINLGTYGVVLGTGNLKIELFVVFSRAVNFNSVLWKVHLKTEAPRDGTLARTSQSSQWSKWSAHPFLKLVATPGVPHLSRGQEEKPAAVPRWHWGLSVWLEGLNVGLGLRLSHHKGVDSCGFTTKGFYSKAAWEMNMYCVYMCRVFFPPQK